MRKSFVAFALAVAAPLGIVSHAALADEGGPAIVHLAMRDHLVTISASPDGPRYSIRDRSGNLLSADISDEELLASYPQLYQRINSGVAGDDSESFIWAGQDAVSVELPGVTVTKSRSTTVVEPPDDSVVDPAVDSLVESE